MVIAQSADTRTKAGNRALILAAAPKVLRRTGIQGFALNEVAREAGLARQTIYNHFDGRDDLLAALLVQEMLTRHAPIQEELGRGEPSAEHFVDLLVAELAAGKQFALYEDMLSPATGPRIAGLVFSSDAVEAAREAAWLPILRTYEEAGVLRAGLDHREVVRWLTWQEFWILTHPGMLCDETPTELRRWLETFLVPSVVVVDLETGTPGSPRAHRSAADR